MKQRGKMPTASEPDVDVRVDEESRWKSLAERLDVAMEASRQGGYEVDVASGGAVVTSTYWSILGEPPDREPMTVSEWSERIHPEDRARMLRDVEATFTGSALRETGSAWETGRWIARPDDGA